MPSTMQADAGIAATPQGKPNLTREDDEAVTQIASAQRAAPSTAPFPSSSGRAKT